LEVSLGQMVVPNATTYGPNSKHSVRNDFNSIVNRKALATKAGSIDDDDHLFRQWDLPSLTSSKPVQIQSWAQSDTYRFPSKTSENLSRRLLC
jgi:hypothetical protein